MQRNRSGRRRVSERLASRRIPLAVLWWNKNLVHRGMPGKTEVFSKIKSVLCFYQPLDYVFLLTELKMSVMKIE